MKRRIVIIAATLSIAMSLGAAPRTETNLANGLSLNVPLVGRVSGGGGVLYRTSLDLSNNRTFQTVVDFYFDGRDNEGGVVTATGSINNNGVAPLGEGTLRGNTNVHFDDFIQSLVEAGFVTAAQRDRGIIGSVLLVFDSFAARGDASATARFYNAFEGGFVGVSISGREITTDESTAVTGFVHDTRGSASGQKQYNNIFLNNTGFTPSGAVAGPVIVELRAVSANTGTPIGRAISVDIAAGHTATISDVSGALLIGGEPAIVTARVTTGDAAIHGLVNTLDNISRDGSVVYMTPAR